MDKRVPRKILMTADAIGGVWTYALELARALAPYKVEIALATMGGSVSRDQHKELASLPNVVLFENHSKLEWMDDPWTDVEQAGDWLLDLASRFQPDLIHLNGFCHGALPWNAPVLIVAHSCVLSWWAAVKSEEAPPQYAKYQRRVREGLAAADCVVAPTAAMPRLINDFYGPFERQKVIYNARDPKQFVPGSKERRIFSAGRFWDEAKNIGALERIASSVRWPIYVAGDGEHPNGAPLKLKNALPLGKLTAADMAAQLGASAIYALPARYEPFGLSALEAGLCGCALVLGDIPSLREVWGNAALFVAPEDDDALKKTLNTLINDDTRVADLARRSRARALGFSPQTMVTQYMAAYDSCLKHQPLEEAAA